MASNTYKKTGDAELTIYDVLKFFKSNWRSVALLTLLFSALAVAIVFLLPRQHQKQVSFSVEPNPNGPLAALESITLPLPEEVGPEAAGYLIDGGLSRYAISATYNPSTLAVDAVFHSRDEGLLEGEAARDALKHLEKRYQEKYGASLNDTIAIETTRTGFALEISQAALERIDGELERLPSEAESDEARALAVERAGIVSDIAQTEARRGKLEDMNRDLPRLSAQAVLVEVVGETQAQSARSPVALVVLAILASLVAAISLTLLRTLLLRRK